MRAGPPLRREAAFVPRHTNWPHPAPPRGWPRLEPLGAQRSPIHWPHFGCGAHRPKPRPHHASKKWQSGDGQVRDIGAVRADQTHTCPGRDEPDGRQQASSAAQAPQGPCSHHGLLRQAGKRTPGPGHQHKQVCLGMGVTAPHSVNSPLTVAGPCLQIGRLGSPHGAWSPHSRDLILGS